jgi:hypothetical protein
MATDIQNFRDLIVWQKAMALAKEIYRIAKCFPREERFAFTNQICRAALSVPSNIAEGHARQEENLPTFSLSHEVLWPKSKPSCSSLSKSATSRSINLPMLVPWLTKSNGWQQF